MQGRKAGERGAIVARGVAGGDVQGLPTPRPFPPPVNAAFGYVVAQQMVRLVAERETQNRG
jgi:hypothetical protein